MILSPKELFEITGKVRWSSQAKELDVLGIPFRRRSDGSPLVFEEDLHATAKEKQKPPVVRLSAIR